MQDTTVTAERDVLHEILCDLMYQEPERACAAARRCLDAHPTMNPHTQELLKWIVRSYKNQDGLFALLDCEESQ